MKKQQPHNTIKNFCCACEYDQIIYQEKLELAKQKQKQDIIKMIEGMEKSKNYFEYNEALQEIINKIKL